MEFDDQIQTRSESCVIGWPGWNLVQDQLPINKRFGPKNGSHRLFVTLEYDIVLRLIDKHF